MSRNSGFTLLECLIALLMLSGVLLLFSGLLQHAHKMDQALIGYHQLEWEIFLLQLDNEMENVNYKQSSRYEIVGETESKGRIVPVVINTVNKKIVKHQSGGYQPLLTGVKEFVCQENNQGVDFRITFTDGKQKSGTWIYQ